MTFEWNDYKTEDAAEIDTWLDESAIRFTGMDDGWNADVEYWKENAGDDLFRCKTISFDGVMTGAVYIIGWHEDDTEGFTIGEIILRPDARGKGLGTAMLKDLLDRSGEIIGTQLNPVDAVIFTSNTASKRMFEKAGFTVKTRDDDPTTMDALYCRDVDQA